MECNFSKNMSQIVKIEDQELTRSYHFRYFGSIINKEGEIEKGITNRIRANG